MKIEAGSPRFVAGALVFAYLAAILSIGDGAFGATETQPAGAWKPTGSMNEARAEHTATLLTGPDCRTKHPPAYCGKTLVAGGADVSAPPKAGDAPDQKPLASAELYDPVTGTWTTTGSLHEPRMLHLAVLLDGPNCGNNCGKVLVAAGLGPREPGGNSLSAEYQAKVFPLSAELYDPATGRWKPTKGSASVNHWTGTAILISGAKCGKNCGKVIVFGGGDGAAVLSAEMYNPRSDSWEKAPPPSLPHSGLGAILISGPHCGKNCGKVLALGSRPNSDSSGVSLAAELFDPGLEVWIPAAGFDKRMTPFPGITQMATLKDGKVMVVGSDGGVRLFDPDKGIWQPAAGSSGPGEVGTDLLTLSDGSIMAAGAGVATNRGDGTGTVDIVTQSKFLPAGSSGTTPAGWKAISSPAIARAESTISSAGCSPLGAQALIAGGFVAGAQAGVPYSASPTAELFFPNSASGSMQSGCGRAAGRGPGREQNNVGAARATIPKRRRAIVLSAVAAAGLAALVFAAAGRRRRRGASDG